MTHNEGSLYKGDPIKWNITSSIFNICTSDTKQIERIIHIRIGWKYLTVQFFFFSSTPVQKLSTTSSVKKKKKTLADNIIYTKFNFPVKVRKWTYIDACLTFRRTTRKNPIDINSIRKNSSGILTIGRWDGTHHAHLLNQKLGKKPPKIYRVCETWN